MKSILNSLLILTLIWVGSSYAIIVEAEEATVKTTGGPIDDGWNLWSYGTLGEYFRIKSAGLHEVKIHAYGSPLEGIWPLMVLNLDGVATGKAQVVTKNSLTNYTFQVELTPGVHFIGGIFLNDAYNPGVEDRNLYIDKIEISTPDGLAEPVISSEDKWSLEAKAREEAVLQKTYEEIKKNRMGTGTITILDDKGKPIPEVLVTIELIRHDFLFGCNIFKFDNFKTKAENNTYKRLFKELFNYATIPFYWRKFEIKQGKPDYAYWNKLVAWCKENEIRMKGHPLLWDKQAGIPEWSDGQPAPEVQQKHVIDIIKKYEGEIEFWEVVNEPAHLPNLSIDNPYSWAREASPDANLIVNEFGVLTDGYPPFFELLQDASQNRVPFEGIGVQAHTQRDMAFPLGRVQTILDMYANLGKEIHITEFTPQSNLKKVTGSPWRNVWSEAQQADYAEKFYRICFAHPAVVAITWWDLSDQGSWLEGGGMLRGDLSPKPVYESLKKLIHEEWQTSLQGKTDHLGRFQFSGFYGLYKVNFQKNGASLEAEFHLNKNKQNYRTYEFQNKIISTPTNLRMIVKKIDKP
jgi:GH35 family endo-1,4-beta-xylanase